MICLKKTKRLCLTELFAKQPKGIRGAKSELQGIIFQRGHGSVWGNQFYIHICPDEICQLRFLGYPGGEPVCQSHLPVARELWEQVKDAVRKTKPQKQKKKTRMLDGSEYRKLTLMDHRGRKREYALPCSAETAALESILLPLIPINHLEENEL